MFLLNGLHHGPNPSRGNTKAVDSPLQSKCDASKSVSSEVEDPRYVGQRSLFSAVCSEAVLSISCPRRHSSSQAPLSSKRGGSLYICIEWCVYVCGFRGSHVDVPLAKTTSAKTFISCQWGSFTPPKLANAKIKPFIFFFLENRFTNTLLNILLSVYK